MTKRDEPRNISARRLLTLGGVAATLAIPIGPAVGTAGVAPSQLTLPVSQTSPLLGIQKISANVPQTGGGEGEGATNLPGDIDFLRDLGFISGHLRVGMALLKDKDLTAASIHMNHPIEEKYQEIATRLKELGFGDLKGDLLALSKATDAGRPLAEVQALFDAAIARIQAAAAASPSNAGDRVMALVELGRIAAGDYSAGVNNGIIVDLAEYQDSWGFIQTIQAQADVLATSKDANLAAAAAKIKDLLDGIKPAYGDLQAKGIAEYDPSLVYGAAARMEIVALGLK